MGWDAFSSAKFNWDKDRFVNPAHKKAFNTAVQLCKRKAGGCDGGLKIGMLGCSACGTMLTTATGVSCYGEWSSEKVKELNTKANWHFKYLTSEAWAYWSARTFLETCAELNLSIKFC